MRHCGSAICPGSDVGVVGQVLHPLLHATWADIAARSGVPLLNIEVTGRSRSFGSTPRVSPWIRRWSSLWELACWRLGRACQSDADRHGPIAGKPAPTVFCGELRVGGCQRSKVGASLLAISVHDDLQLLAHFRHLKVAGDQIKLCIRRRKLMFGQRIACM